MTHPELERLLCDENPSIDLDAEIASLEHDVDRFAIYRSLLEPLAGAKQSPIRSRYAPRRSAAKSRGSSI